MDPISQGVVGSHLSQSTVKNRHNLKIAALLGFLSGMAPDLDVLIHSSTDPLLGLEYHRQFTHSLIFIPIGGFLCALVSRLFTRKTLSFMQAYLFCTVGWATHGLLDACTTYGTLLFWPFSYQRFAWNNVSIIDPLFTIPLLILMALACIKQSRKFALIGTAYIFIYLSFGGLQSYRAKSYIKDIAQKRAHVPTKLMVSPSFANLFLWRTVYEYDKVYYVDAVKIGVKKQFFKGTTIKKYNRKEHTPWLKPSTVQSKDIERFRWFTNDYLAWSEKYPIVVQDVRYAISPRSAQSLWGLWLDPAMQNEHVTFERIVIENKADKEDFWNLLFRK